MRVFNYYFPLVTTCISLALGAPASSSGAQPTVTASSGVVVGTLTSVVSAGATTTRVYNYLGVPFAAIPTSTKRFYPPEATSWTGIVSATSLPPACVQQFPYPRSEHDFLEEIFNNPGGPAPAESEDCLYLNIYAPLDASPTNTKPVLFWIFGGNLQFGTGALSYYNGSSFAGFQDVVVVTINYRTNVFGFSNSPELAPGTQNAGFLDQRMALNWVHDNIMAFGGDPSKVTIFGQSAGGYSTKQLLAHPPDPLPYRAAILLSEATLFSSPGNQSYEQTVSNFGCDKETSPLACLQKVSASDLKSYVEVNSVAFPPVDDNVTRSTDVRSSITSGKFANVPVMMGTTADEARVFLAAIGLDGGNGTIESYIEQIIPNNTLINSVILDVYSALQTDTFLAASALVTDLLFTCTTSELSGVLADNGHDVWRYYYNASYVSESLFTDAGAYHSSELPQVFGTYPLQNALGRATSDQKALSKYMQTVWANFAKNPGAGPGWVKLEASSLFGPGRKMQDLGGINQKGGVLIDTSEADGTCPLLDPIIAAMGI